ncbi:Phosphomevalonate kinase [Eremomyces bilateralis CBS 781.70]|uniref:Phosphomevalonate kinase n=1 Tax=Eremomyces bilateralis CBS 781.70 TaxID=1392243 RepID=A0A6G1G855_9PEZI|nr:Phosphomevalonate kinase [Eremomyces bilateralis CBS 781.70]KAF1814214.1 Phosphomevalonate kinase [Eremomyces bilateralis CBS 781.70]
MTAQPTAVSAPGKVLLAGGYLVLDRQYTGLVFGLSARIHVVVRPRASTDGVSEEVVVKSPQFEEAVWEYGYRVREEGGGVTVTQLRAASPNPFVETALSHVLTYLTTLSPSPLPPTSIAILADNDYYSHPSTPSTPRFLHFAVPLPSAHKTGLGSSAALVTAFTAALLTHHLPSSTFDLNSSASRALLHNLAQAAHCAAQGKVGSGFDVAAAVYGSCVYRRFSPDVLSGQGEAGSAGFVARLRTTVEDAEGKWDTEVRKGAVAVPAGLRLVMCDVHGGTQTPGMVRRVLGWRAEHREEADALWGELQQENEALAEELRRLAEGGGERGDGKYRRLTECFAAIRTLTRKMSTAADVPIEPKTQTMLLDACTALDGVVGGVVPGAGGFDAVAVLIEDRPEVLDRLKRLVDGYVFDAETDREQKPGRVKILDVREEMEGVRTEDVAQYQDWLS